MKISELGENALIKSFLNLKKENHVLIGPGDDACLLKVKDNILVTIDSFTQLRYIFRPLCVDPRC